MGVKKFDFLTLVTYIVYQLWFSIISQFFFYFFGPGDFGFLFNPTKECNMYFFKTQFRYDYISAVCTDSKLVFSGKE